MKKQYLRVDEVAEMFRVCKRTVYRWIEEGRLPAYKIGDRIIRIRAADLEALEQPADEIVT